MMAASLCSGDQIFLIYKRSVLSSKALQFRGSGILLWMVSCQLRLAARNPPFAKPLLTPLHVFGYPVRQPLSVWDAFTLGEGEEGVRRAG